MLNISSPTFNPARWSGYGRPAKSGATENVIPQSANSASLFDTANNRGNQPSREVLDMPGLGISRPKDVVGDLQFAGGMKFTRYAWNGTQTASEASGGLRYYTEPGRITRETKQALEAETKSLGNKVSKALKSAGVELTKDDKLSFTVGEDGKISVNSKGLSKENRSKIEEIEEALNSDPKLAKELKLNSAGKKVNDREYAEENAPPGTATVTPAHYGDDDPAMAAAQAELMDDYLQANFGFGLEDVADEEWIEGAEYDTLYGHVSSGEMNWDQGMELMNQVKHIAGNHSKNGGASYTATFTFQNGELTDGFGTSAPKKAEQSEAAAGASAMESLVARLNSIRGNGKTEQAVSSSPENSWINSLATNNIFGRIAAQKAYGSI